MPAFRVALNDISPQHIQTLIDEKWPEDELLEYKKTLSTSSGSPDRWVVDQSEIGTAAKRDVLAEVVAMANSYGGDVLLGIDELREEGQPPWRRGSLRFHRA